MSKLPDKETKKGVDTSTNEIKDIIAEEKIAKLEDTEEKQSRKNKKLKNKVSNRNIFIVILLIIIDILLIRSCSETPQMSVMPDVERVVRAIPEEYDMTEHEDGEVIVMGWNEGQKVISKSEPFLALINVSANADYYLKFKVSKGDDVLYESKLVVPGGMIAPDFPKDLDIGEHDVVVSATAYSIDDTSKQLSTADTKLKIIMTE